MDTFYLDGANLSIEDVVRVAQASPEELRVVIAESAGEKIRRGRRCVEDVISSGKVHYGINTGFGAFRDRLISPTQLRQLQRSIVVSHSVGVGCLMTGRGIS